MLRIRVFRSKGLGECWARARHTEAPVEFGIGLQNCVHSISFCN